LPNENIAIPVGFSSIIAVRFYRVIGLLLIPAAFALAWLGHLIEGNELGPGREEVNLGSARNQSHCIAA
jgi:hypothetical protein